MVKQKETQMTNIKETNKKPFILDTVLTVKCIECNKKFDYKVRMVDVIKRISTNAPIQECFPYLDINDREIFISRMCSDCFDNITDVAIEDG